MVTSSKILLVSIILSVAGGCADADALRKERAAQHRGDEPVGVPIVSLPDTAVSTASEVIEGVITTASTARGGEFVAQVFVRPPVRAPRDLCVRISGDGHPLYNAPLTQPKEAHRPGVTPAVLFRHRVYAPLPVDVEAGVMSTSFELVDCSSGGVLGSTTQNVAVLNTRVTDAQITEAAGEMLTARPALPRVREVTTGDEGDVLRTIALPRAPKEGTQLVYSLGRVDPTVWTRPANVLRSNGGTTHPRSPMVGLLQTIKDGFAVASIASPATRLGQPPPPNAEIGPPRRVVPEKLGLFFEAGIDALLLGDKRVDDAGLVGRIWTHRNARHTGLDVPYRGSVIVPEEQSAPRIAVIDMTDGKWDEAPMRIQSTNAQVLLVAAAQTTRAQLHALADLGVHGIWSVATHPSSSPSAVDVYNGVPIIENLAVAISDEPKHSTELLRWYIDAEGVHRVDILLFQHNLGVLHRDDAGKGRDRLLARASESAAVGIDLHVGAMMAGLDVRAHWPSQPPLFELSDSMPDRPGLSAPESKVGTPPRCYLRFGEEPPVTPTSLARGGLAVSAWPISVERRAGEPIRFGMWIKRNDPRIENGVMVWHGTGSDGSVWRAILEPCDGSVSFATTRLEQVISYEVWLWPPRDQPEALVPSEFTLQVRAMVEGNLAVLRQDDGRRAITVEVPNQL